MKKTTKNIIFAAVILALAGGLWLMRLGAQPGKSALVEVIGGETQTISLETDGIYHIEDAQLPVTLEVKDGKIRFIDSQCPDHLCEGFGWVQTEYDSAVCVPSGVSVRVKAQ